jgi:hypothetical protein
MENSPSSSEGGAVLNFIAEAAGFEVESKNVGFLASFVEAF